MREKTQCTAAATQTIESYVAHLYLVVVKASGSNELSTIYECSPFCGSSCGVISTGRRVCGAGYCLDGN